ncbi:hypothetical protein HanPI659440_Chr10g0391591 [Helianthus annuus]|nr:hypothetical protein HanPI659440_Chr10g0391591 [Helianthus annuus]
MNPSPLLQDPSALSRNLQDFPTRRLGLQCQKSLKSCTRIPRTRTNYKEPSPAIGDQI